MLPEQPDELQPPLRPDDTPPTSPDLALSALEQAVVAARQELHRIIIGQERFIDLLLATLLAGGHVLVEGVPGIAKTLTAKLLAQTLDVPFSRIQFTPDLMPSDVVGTSVFNMRESDFTFSAGPIFASVVLIDEINRAPAKTQSALFEVMEERQVTVDGETYPMTFPFFVLATQNPIEQEGTYRLPEAQLDRFLVKINIDYPDLEEEKQILRRFSSDFNLHQREVVQPVFTADLLRECRQRVEQVFIREELLDYIAGIVHRTRHHPDIFLGASPRASLALLRMSKALAAMDGRDYVTPDDIRSVAYSVLNHRIVLLPEREMEGYTGQDVIDEIVQQVAVPR